MTDQPDHPYTALIEEVEAYLARLPEDMHVLDEELGTLADCWDMFFEGEDMEPVRDYLDELRPGVLGRYVALRAELAPEMRTRDGAEECELTDIFVKQLARTMVMDCITLSDRLERVNADGAFNVLAAKLMAAGTDIVTRLEDAGFKITVSFDRQGRGGMLGDLRGPSLGFNDLANGTRLLGEEGSREEEEADRRALTRLLEDYAANWRGLALTGWQVPALGSFTRN